MIGLSKTYGRQNIWHDVTLTLPPGEITAMMGPSGTGKSVFLTSIIGLVEPEEGQILIDGADMVSVRESHRLELVGLVGQEHKLPRLGQVRNRSRA